jgi:tetratricopeptide (TPR) repeat protein
MLVRQLRFSIETTNSSPLYDRPASTASSQMRVSVGPGLLVLDTDEQARIIDFQRQRELTLDHVARTREATPMFARVHDRVAGFLSGVHVLNTLAAGGSTAFGKLWQLHAAYAIAPALPDEPPTPKPERIDDGDTRTWSIEGLEIAYLKPSDTPLDRLDLARLLAHATYLHPDVATEVIAAARVPAELHTQNHFPANMLDQRFVLVDTVERAEFDLDAMLAGYDEAPAIDPIHALARRQLDGPRPNHIAAARAAFDDKRLVEAQLACFAHTIAELDTLPAQALLRDISERAWRFSAARRLLGLIEPTRDPKLAPKRAAALDKLRGKAGAYEHILDVFIGEHHLELHELDAAYDSLGRALQADPYLTGAWISIGRVHIDRLEFNRGWQCWDQALRQRPQHNIVRTALDWCQNLMADFPQFF